MKIVVIGSITEDIIKTPTSGEKHFIGGVPVYAAATATALGETIGIVSKVGLDFQVKNLQVLNSFNADLTGFKIKGNSSMKFENSYNQKGIRTQRILSVSERLTIRDIPKGYFDVSCVHLGPVFNEIDLELLSTVRDHFKIVSLDGQGFTRSTEENDDKIVLRPWLDFEEYLPKVDILKVDDTELKSITSTTRIIEGARIALSTGLKLLVITMAHEGAIIFHGKKRYNIPALPTKVIDETGAGDTFITAFLLEYLRTNDCYYSGLIAASAAAFKIGTSGPLPTYNRSDVIERVKSFLPDFQEK